MWFEIYRDKSPSREWRWRLWSDNNSNKIATSGEGYQRECDCRHGINLVKGAANAPVYDEKGNRLDDDGVLEERKPIKEVVRRLNVIANRD